MDTLIPREKEKVPILRGTGVPFGCPKIVQATGIMKIKRPHILPRQSDNAIGKLSFFHPLWQVRRFIEGKRDFRRMFSAE